MNDKNNSQQYNLAENASEKESSLASQMQADDESEFPGTGFIPEPKGDGEVENKVATSLDDE